MLSARRALRVLLVVVLGLTIAVSGGGPAAAAEATVDLGTASSYAVLAATTVTNTNATTVSGNLGVSPGAAVTGFPPGIVSNGTIHQADAHAASAKSAFTTAYDDAAGRSTTAAIAADLGGQTLAGGVYTGGAIGLTGTVTLDGEGDPASVFIFQASSTLITASASRVRLINGADPCNVFWQVGSSATLGTSSRFVGTLLAQTAVTADAGATITGRLFAGTAAVTLDNNAITRTTCAAATATTTTSSSTSSSTSSTTTSSSSTTSTTMSTTTSTTASAGTPIGGADSADGADPTDGPDPTAPVVDGTGAGPSTTFLDSGSTLVIRPRVGDGSSVELPRTGGSVGDLGVLGAASVLSGFVLVLGARRDARRRTLTQ